MFVAPGAKSRAAAAFASMLMLLGQEVFSCAPNDWSFESFLNVFFQTRLG